MEQQLRRMASVATFPWPVYLVMVAAAGILALSRVHAAHDADTLLWGLISLDRLMPFYWQDNRIGTLVPWIASMVRDPYANLQLQVFVWSLGTLLCPVLLGALILRTQTTKALAAAQLGLVYLALAWLYRLGNPRTQVVLFLGHPYGLGLALALGTLLFARTVRPSSARLAGVLVLSFLTAWMNILMMAFLLPALLFLPGVNWRNLRGLLGHTALISAACIGPILEQALSRQYPANAYFLAVAGLQAVPGTLYHLSVNHFTYIARPAAFLSLLIISLSALIVRRAQVPLRVDYRRTIPLLIGASAVCLTLGYSLYPVVNLYHERYLTGVTLLLGTLVSFAVSDVVLAAMKAGQWSGLRVSLLAWVTSGILIVGEIRQFGVPSPAAARQTLEAQFSMDRAALLAAGCTHLVGNYWLVWPRVFDYNAGVPGKRIWGITERSQATRDLWDLGPQAGRVYCGLSGDPAVSIEADGFGLPPLQPSASFGNITRFSTASTLSDHSSR
jgi:hypothetical protein